MQVSGYAMRGKEEPLERLDYDAEVGAGQALVEVCGCGVCHTDIGFLEGVPTRHELPLVLGHEVSGRVLEVGEGAPASLVGRSVIVPAVLPCGECAMCAKGRGEICKKQVFPGNDVHGGFATHLVEDAARGVNLKPGDVVHAVEEMKDKGVRPVVSSTRSDVLHHGWQSRPTDEEGDEEVG